MLFNTDSTKNQNEPYDQQISISIHLSTSSTNNTNEN